MMRIMARWMKAATVLAERSKSRARRRKRLSQAKVRSTIQRLGRTSNPTAVGERSTISIVLRLFRYPLVTPLARKWMLSRNLEPLSGQQLAKGSSNVPVDRNAFNR
jgi:hypothetical protein